MDRTANRTLPAIAIGAALACVAAFVVGCSPARWQEVRPMSARGPRIASGVEPAAMPLAPSAPARGREFTTTGRVPGYRQPGTTAHCALENDRVVIVSPDSDSEFIEVQTQTPTARAACGDRVWIRRAGVETARPEVADARRARHYVVINAATQRLRVYEICRASDCQGNRLAVDVPAIVGPNLPGRRTWLGEYSITGWFKFYSDNAGKYPSFFSPELPDPPRAGAPISAWLSPNLLPVPLRGRPEVQRGNFGWYTAQLGPNADGQWVQGTWGRGADGDRFIRLARQNGAESGFDLQTHGCTRVDNPTIAYLRQILAENTPVLRIYAREELAGTATPAPQASAVWNWILTKRGVDVEGAAAERADRDEVLRAGVPRTEWLDSGAYSIPSRPVVASGNTYGVPDSEMRGVFFVDRGTLSAYAHPVSLQAGGYEGRLAPRFAIAP